jgi:protein-disulfide isomerase
MAQKSSNDKLTPVLIGASIFLAFVVGVLWQRVSNLEGGGTAKTTTTTNNQAAVPTQQQGAPSDPSTYLMDEDRARNVPEVSSSDYARGASNPKVYMIEYSDYECPFCTRFHPTAQAVIDNYGDQVAWVYRHFPLDQIHPRARPAAEAAECVGEIGGSDAFWRFTDYLFENQATALTDLANSAQQVGISTAAFNNCMDSDKYADKVQEQYVGGQNVGVQGTPAIFVMSENGNYFIPGALDYSTVEKIIQAAIS